MHITCLENQHINFKKKRDKIVPYVLGFPLIPSILSLTHLTSSSASGTNNVLHALVAFKSSNSNF